jgi:hypothetical protein
MTSARRGNTVLRYGHLLTESYTLEGEGIEQKFVLQHRFSHSIKIPALVMNVRGDLRPLMHGNSFSLIDSGGRPVIQWGEWKAFDADHRVLPMRFALTGKQLNIFIHDQNARYPIVIDPLFSQTTPDFTPQGGYGFGQMSQISNDGRSLVIGAFNADINGNVSSGSAFVFHLQNGSWQQTAGFSDPTANFFGVVTAISGDGSQVLIGATNIGLPGTSYFYTNASGQWKQVAEFSDPGGTNADQYGAYVALASNANVAFVSAPWTPVQSCNVVIPQGRVFVYELNSGIWTQVQELDDPNASACSVDLFGASISLSADGNTALIGNEYAPAYIFKNIGGSWVLSATLTQPPNSLYFGQTSQDAEFGDAGALSADGDTAVIGAPNANTATTGYAGEVFVFRNIGDVWTQIQEFDDPNGPYPAGELDHYGNSVAVSNDGTLVAIGAHDSPTYQGSYGPGQAYLFKESDGQWTQTYALNDPGNAYGDNYASSVGLSASLDPVAVKATIQHKGH